MIHGFSDVVRIPRLGKIRLGIKATSAKGVEYPKAVDYFVCPPEVQAVYGEKPKEIDIMLPYEDIETVFPTALKRYGKQAGLLCRGDGRTAQEAVEGTEDWKDIPCPYQDCKHYQNQYCQEVGNLQVILPKVKGCLGVYQIDTTSFNSVTNIKNGLALLKKMIGRISMVPLVLEVKMTETHPIVNGRRIQSIVPVMNLKIAATWYEILEQARQNKLVQAVNTSGVLAGQRLEIEGEVMKDDVDYLYPKVLQSKEDPLASEPAPKRDKRNYSDAKPQNEEFAKMVDECCGGNGSNGSTIDVEGTAVSSEDEDEENPIDQELHEAWDILGTPKAKRTAILNKPNLNKQALLSQLNAEIDRRSDTELPPAPPPQAPPPAGSQQRAFF